MTPYVVMLTSHHLRLDAVLVAPLFAAPRTVDVAELAVTFQGAALVLSLIDMAGVEPQRLRRRIGSLADQEETVRRGLERLFTEF